MTAPATEAVTSTGGHRAGIVGYHAYLPAYRLDRGEIAAAVGASARGTRRVAGYDEDTTTLGVAAALPVVTGREAAVGSVCADLGASVRSGVVALLAAARDGGLAVLADRRGGPAGGTDEREGGDAAAAFLFGDQEPLALVTG